LVEVEKVVTIDGCEIISLTPEDSLGYYSIAKRALSRLILVVRLESKKVELAYFEKSFESACYLRLYRSINFPCLADK
jgi:hypothetical protein